MEVILLQDIRKLGQFGSTVRVAKGFGRNYLIPQGKAVPATKAHLAEFEERRAELQKLAKENFGSAQERAAEIGNVQLIIHARASEEGKLYGSVGTHELADALAEQGITVARREIKLPEGALREIGQHEIQLDLHADVTVALHLSIVPQKH